MRTTENACTLRFDSRHYADGSHIFHKKGVGKVNDDCKLEDELFAAK